MGYLKTAGPPLSYADLQKIKAYIKEHGILQFINLFRLFRNFTIPAASAYKWGDETEHHVIYWNHDASEVKLLANAGDFMEYFNDSYSHTGTQLQPEYGAWMLEAVPCKPFTSLDLKPIAGLDNFYRNRRVAISDYLSTFGNFSISNMASYPLLGVGDYAIRFPQLVNSIKLAKAVSKETHLHNPSIDLPLHAERRDSDPSKEEAKTSPESEHELLPLDLTQNKYSKSLFTFDGAINPHPRFPTLSERIRERRGEKVCIKVPLYMDYKTIIQGPTEADPYPGYIYMDSMAFGMGCCCLQLTYQAQTIDHARYLHDQLLAIAPILAALSASAPIYRGRLGDIDLRFNVISQSVDDRTVEERNPQSEHYIPKPRYGHNSHYISNHDSVMSHHNDTTVLEVDPEHIRLLKETGVDDRLAYHIASLFVRDPLVVFEKGVEVDDQKSTAHFENLQSTNWNTIRFKPPPAHDSTIGWRVEFRPMDIQLTDYENGALSALVSLLVKLLSSYNVNFIIPISMGDENMERAHKRDAVLNQKFFFRKNIVQNDYKETALGKTGFLQNSTKLPAEREEVEEMTVAEILGGKPEVGHKGIFPLLEELISEDKAATIEEKAKVRGYLEFLLGRAKGLYKTGAKYIRGFVRSHPDYDFDSVVTEKINYDLSRQAEEINAGKLDPRVIYAVPPPPKEVNVAWGREFLVDICIGMPVASCIL